MILFLPIEFPAWFSEVGILAQKLVWLVWMVWLRFGHLCSPILQSCRLCMTQPKQAFMILLRWMQLNRGNCKSQPGSIMLWDVQPASNHNALYPTIISLYVKYKLQTWNPRALCQGWAKRSFWSRLASLLVLDVTSTVVRSSSYLSRCVSGLETRER